MDNALLCLFREVFGLAGGRLRGGGAARTHSQVIQQFPPNAFGGKANYLLFSGQKPAKKGCFGINWTKVRREYLPALLLIAVAMGDATYSHVIL